jgi:hypothetical protein
MKFIKLTNGANDKITYTVNVNSIACIETTIDEKGEVFTWIHSKDFEYWRLHVKETEEQILKVLQKIEFAKSFRQLMV